jgi:DNA-binding HxlR family transcriptional regulator
MPMTSRTAYRSDCPIASTLDILGDRWSMLIIRDMTFGKRKFSEFLASSEGITRNILADRLRRLEAEGLIRKTLYQSRPDRFAYSLTNRGADVLPVVQSLARWGGKHIHHTYAPPDVLLGWGPEEFYEHHEPASAASG